MSVSLHKIFVMSSQSLYRTILSELWETDFYTPPVLGGAALLPLSAPAVYKNPVP